MKNDPTNNCTFFSCVKIHNQLISSVSNITCPDFDPSTCLPVSPLGVYWPPTHWSGPHGAGWGAPGGEGCTHSPFLQGSIKLMPNGCCKTCEYPAPSTQYCPL